MKNQSFDDLKPRRCFWCNARYRPEKLNHVLCAGCRRKQRRKQHQAMRRRAEIYAQETNSPAREQYLAYLENEKVWSQVAKVKLMSPKEFRQRVMEERRRFHLRQGIYRFYGHECERLKC